MNQRGSILLEGLLGIVVLSMVILAIVPMLSFLLRRTAISRSENQAGLLLQEAVESTYNIFTSQWDAYPDGIYHPAKATNGTWALVSGDEDNLETLYTREVRIQKACRDQNGEIITTQGACGGTLDPDSKVITAKVGWEESNNPKELTANYLLINMTNK